MPWIMPRAFVPLRRLLRCLPINNLGLALVQLADYSAAERALQLAISGIELAKGAGDVDVVYSLNNLGGMLVVKHDLAGAPAAFRRGLEIRTKVLGPQDVRARQTA